MTQEAPTILQNKQAVPSLPNSALPDPVLSLSLPSDDGLDCSAGLGFGPGLVMLLKTDLVMLRAVSPPSSTGLSLSQSQAGLLGVSSSLLSGTTMRKSFQREGVIFSLLVFKDLQRELGLPRKTLR